MSNTFSLTCDNCDEMITLNDGDDGFFTAISLIAQRDETIKIKCKNCETVIEII